MTVIPGAPFEMNLAAPQIIIPSRTGIEQALVMGCHRPIASIRR
jgi:hypothetical protein